MRRGSVLLLTTLALIAGLARAEARTRALLVGVAAYDDPAIPSLHGPRNDIILLWRVLTARGVRAEDIDVLAEGLPSTANTPVARSEPTRAAILDALSRLARNAEAGDLVIIHYSGHGTTQPEVDADRNPEPEPDGRDQVLLPKDAGRFDPVTQRIQNGIVDDEIGEALDRIRARGATVWMIVDACHAGTVTRGAGMTVRAVEPSALGVPEGTRPAAAVAAPERRGALHGLVKKGSLIGFFAVDSWSEAIEREAEISGEGLVETAGKPRVGVFSWHLVRAINSNRARSYRDLSRLVSLDMMSAGGLAQAPLPVFDGDLDLGLFGAQAGSSARFPARVSGGEVLISAGRLAGFDDGAEVVFHAGPLDDAPRLGSGRIVDSDAAGSRAEPPGGAAKPLPPEVWTSIAAPAVALRLRVAADGDGAADRARAEALLDTLLASAATEGAGGMAIDRSGGGIRDLVLHAGGGRLWLVPDGQPLVREAVAYGRSVSVALADRQDADVIADLKARVWTFARAANLVRIAGAADLGSSDRNMVEIALERVRDLDPARLADPKRKCDAALDTTRTDSVTSGDAAAVAHCDQLRLVIINRGDRDFDIGVFFLDPAGGISVPVRDWRQSGCVGYLPAKSSRPLALRTTVRTWDDKGPSAIGQHRILVFALPRSERQPPSLCHLLQPSADAARAEAAGTRGSATGFVRLLERAALVDPGLRSANPFEDDAPGAPAAVVRQFVLDIRPPPQVAGR